ncbi:Mitochondrial sodium/hydrogen exchanger 9B2, partial [Armadillidium nasatum]
SRNDCLTSGKKLSTCTSSINSEDLDCGTCGPILRKNRTLQPNPSFCDKVIYAMSCPPQGMVGQMLTWILILPISWGVLLTITGSSALPEGNIFSILSLLLLAQIGGFFVSKIGLPPLLGMLLVGIALRSVPGLDIIGANIDQKWSAALRKTALVVILTKAGLGLDPIALKQMSFMVLRLGILPSLVETFIVTLVTHFLLNFPWLWSVMTGFILAGVSPSVVVPCMLSLSDSGYGVEKGVPTLVIAGLSVDNVLSISGFGVMLGIIFSEGKS